MEFVTFEIAKKLMEKGYPQVEKNTLAMYDEDGCVSYLCPTLDINRCYYIFDDFDEDDCVCPTISQVLKWLRKEKQVDILMDILIKYDSNLNRERQYTAKILTPKLNKPIYVCSIYNYEKALISAIEYCLDNLI